MKLDDDTELIYDVSVVGKSNTFHLLQKYIDKPLPNKSVVCGRTKAPMSSSEVHKEDMEEMLESGKEVCEQCINSLEKFYGVKIDVCCICGRLSLLEEIKFHYLDVGYGYSEEESCICDSCIFNIKHQF